VVAWFGEVLAVGGEVEAWWRVAAWWILMGACLMKVGACARVGYVMGQTVVFAIEVWLIAVVAVVCWNAVIVGREGDVIEAC